MSFLRAAERERERQTERERERERQREREREREREGREGGGGMCVDVDVDNNICVLLFLTPVLSVGRHANGPHLQTLSPSTPTSVLLQCGLIRHLPSPR